MTVTPSWIERLTNYICSEIDDDDLREYDLEHYDDSPEESDDEDNGMEKSKNGRNTLPMFSKAHSLAFHTSNAEDPYITIKDEDDSDNEEREELQILATDNLLLAAKLEDEVAHLEVYVYEDSADNLYVHHDIMLPAIPLALEWINMPVNRKEDESNVKNTNANFVAVGTMDPEIEIWDLDLVDSMYPNAILGDPSSTSTSSSQNPTSLLKKKKKTPTNTISTTHHTDSVLALSSSRPHPHLLASASADKTVKLWDLHTLTCAASYTHHTDKVCALSWHPTSSTVLLSGSYDRYLVAGDMRAPDSSPPRWKVDSDVEGLTWDVHSEHTFYVSTESGRLYSFDARRPIPSTTSGGEEAYGAIWTLQAHDKPLSCFSINPVVPGYIATASTDRSVKLWDAHAENNDGETKGPSLVVSRDVGVGKVFGCSFAPDDEVGFRLAVAGSKGSVQVWDTSTNRGVREAFGSRMRGGLKDDEGKNKKERIVKMNDDVEGDTDDEENAEENGKDGGWESMEE